MLDSAILAWPLALACASLVLADRVRLSHRRERLNVALHELRRPLQALTLASSQAAAHATSGRSQLDLALDALAGLDREINGGTHAPPSRLVEARALADDAVERWRRVASTSGRRIELVWSANGSRLVCEPTAIARALDNLIANALEHGTGLVRLEATVRAGRLRLLVADGGAARVAGRGGPAGGGRDPRRGHGLRVVADVAAEHGGRFVACRHDSGARAVLELPLA